MSANDKKTNKTNDINGLNSKVSIIIPTYNVERFVADCIESLINQSYSNIEIIIVDDGSSDSTLQILEDYESQDERIVLIKQRHNGPNHARKEGLKRVNGDYVMFVDSDDSLRTDAVSVLMRHFNDNKDIDIIRFNGKNDITGQVELPALEHGEDKRIVDHNEAMTLLLTTYTFNSLCFQIYKTKLLSTNVFDCSVSSGEDFLANIIIHDRAKRTLLVRDVLYTYRYNPYSTTRATDPQRIADNMFGRVYASLAAIDFAMKKGFSNDLLYRIAYEQVKMTKWSVYRLASLGGYTKTEFEKSVKRAFSDNRDMLGQSSNYILIYIRKTNAKIKLSDSLFVKSILSSNYKYLWWLARISNSVVSIKNRLKRVNTEYSYVGKYMRGRLGNQLFQYAALRQIQETNDDKNEMHLNFSKYVYNLGFSNDLQSFRVRPYVEVSRIRMSMFQRIIIMKDKTVKRVYRFISPNKYKEFRYNYENKRAKKLQKKGIYWKEDGHLKIGHTNAKRKIAIGHFESAKNFESIRPQLLEELRPINPPLKKNKKLYEAIASSESVCISIRRGDFVENQKFAKNYNVCGIDYFEKAVREIKKHVKQPVFIMFSDDIKWCRDNILLPDEIVYYEDGGDPVWEKLRLMYSCKHFIISNSTFSWWAQYLSRNERKIVIAPKTWTNYGYDKDIYDEKWILIDNAQYNAGRSVK